MGGNIIWATDFREETETTRHGGGGKGGGGGGGTEVTEYFYFASLAVALCEGPITGIGRIWADGKPMNLDGVTMRVHLGGEDQERRSLHRGEDGRGEHAGLPRHRLCRLRGAAARALRQPDAAALLRGVPPDPRRRVGREPGARGHADPGLGRVRLRDRGGAPRDRRDHVAGERQRRGACRRHRGRARPAAGLRAERGVGLAGGRLVRRRPARRALPHPPGRRGEREVDVAGKLAGRRRRPRLGASGQPRRSEPPGLRRHAVRQRRRAGDPGAEGPRLPRHLLSVHPDGRAGRQRPAGPVLGQRRGDRPAGLSLARAHHLLAGRGLRRQRRQDRGRGHAGRRLLRRRPAVRLRRRRRAGRVGRRSRRLGPAADDPALRASLRRGGRGRRLPDRLGAARDHAGAERRVDLSGGRRARRPRGRRARRSSGPAPSSATPPTGRSTSGITRRTARATSSSTSTRSGRTTRSTSSASTTTCRSPTGATGSTISTPRAPTRSPTSTTCAATSRAARASTGSTPAPPTARRRSGRRSPTAPPASPWVFRYKDVRSWWSNPHRNRPGGVESGSTTAWVPESKPIRFTEIGCPAVDRGPNQPNVFYDPKSAESFLPYFSRGWRDDAVQRRFLEAALGYWAEPANNPMSGVYSGRMITTAETAAWTWDARPYPAFPARSDVWTDADNWRLGHWLNGRLGSVSLGSLVRELCRRAGLPDDQIDASALADVVHGYLISAHREPARLDRTAGPAVRLRRGRERGRHPLPAARPATGGDARARRSCGRRARRRRGDRAGPRAGDRAAAGAEVAGAERRGGLRRDDRRGAARHRRGAAGHLGELRHRHDRQRRRPALPPGAARGMGRPRDRVVPAAAVAPGARSGRRRAARPRRPADLAAADLDRRCRRARRSRRCAPMPPPSGWRPDPSGSRGRRSRWSTGRRAWRSSTCRSSARACRRTSRSLPSTPCPGRAGWRSGAARARTASSWSPRSAGRRAWERSSPISIPGRRRASISATSPSSISPSARSRA